jgi:hypothetical protein
MEETLTIIKHPNQDSFLFESSSGKKWIVKVIEQLDGDITFFEKFLNRDLSLEDARMVWDKLFHDFLCCSLDNPNQQEVSSFIKVKLTTLPSFSVLPLTSRQAALNISDTSLIYTSATGVTTDISLLSEKLEKLEETVKRLEKAIDKS